MALHVIVGAGPVGTATATLLADRGEQVRVVTRSGRGPEHPAIERVAADATDAARLSALAEGAAALYNCANPQYHRWLTDWPPLAKALLTAAERSGAVLATASNLYGYGRSTARSPRTRRWPRRTRSSSCARTCGATRWPRTRPAASARPRSAPATTSRRTRSSAWRWPSRCAPASAAYVPAPLDVPHSWTSIADVARTLVTAATDERAWGRAWLVPDEPAADRPRSWPPASPR